MRKSVFAALGLCLAAQPFGAAADAATVSISGTRENVNPLLPPGSGRCAPTYFNTVYIAPGSLSSTGSSNFGDFTSTQSHCLVSAPPTSFVDGIFSYDFLAGDSFFGTYTGTVSATGTQGLFDTIENLVVTGGTGRFLGATGTVTSGGKLQFGMLNGRLVGNYAGSVDGLLNLPAVPEPSVWGLLIVGFAATGWSMRRSYKVVQRVRSPPDERTGYFPVAMRDWGGEGLFA